MWKARLKAPTAPTGAKWYASTRSETRRRRALIALIAIVVAVRAVALVEQLQARHRDVKESPDDLGSHWAVNPIQKQKRAWRASPTPRAQCLVGCRLRLFSSNRTTYCPNESISEGICSVGGVDRGRLTPYYPSKCSESRAETVPLVRTGYLPTKML